MCSPFVLAAGIVMLVFGVAAAIVMAVGKLEAGFVMVPWRLGAGTDMVPWRLAVGSNVVTCWDLAWGARRVEVFWAVVAGIVIVFGE